MTLAVRRIAVGLAGYVSFLNLYSVQSLLPLLAQEFGVGATVISATMTATAFAVALAAPFTGVVADVLGRKRVIVAAMAVVSVPTLMIALAASVEQMIIWRFVQGLMLPPIFATTIAYIGEEWPPHEVAAAAGLYTSGASLGGFSGRFVTGILADLLGWRMGFMVLAGFALAAALGVLLMLPRERRFVRSESLATSLRQMLRHFRNPQLVATYAVGFGCLFNFIATFTYITFVLAAPPYAMSPAELGMVFAVYLVGILTTPLVGIAIARWGRRGFILGVLAIWSGGILLTLAPALPVIIVGLAICAGGGLILQAVSTGYVTITATEGRSSAVGLYVACFYTGGSVGAVLPGLAWTAAGWPAVVAMIVVSLALIALVVRFVWKDATV